MDVQQANLSGSCGIEKAIKFQHGQSQLSAFEKINTKLIGNGKANGEKKSGRNFSIIFFRLSTLFTWLSLSLSLPLSLFFVSFLFPPLSLSLALFLTIFHCQNEVVCPARTNIVRVVHLFLYRDGLVEIKRKELRFKLHPVGSIKYQHASTDDGI